MTPLPEGFKPEARIENAGSARLTAQGLDFLEQNLGSLAGSVLGDTVSGGVVTFEVPTSSGDIALGTSYTVCPDGPDATTNPPRCVAEINIGAAQLQITPTAPHNIVVSGPLPIRLQNLPVEIDYGFLGTDTARVVLNGNGACPNNEQTYANIDLDVNVSIEIDSDPTHSRRGYSKVRILQLSVDEDQLADRLKLNCGDSPSGSILNAFKGIVIGFLLDGLIDTLTGTVNEQFCQQANPEVSPSCPVGTTDTGGTCMYPDGSCASIVLGADGNINLGQLLASISPGTKGGLDFLFAAGGQSDRGDGRGWGDLNPIQGGATLGLYGGAEPMPQSNCVKLSELPLPAGIPIPDELLANEIPNWPAEIAGPHVGIALSERFTNYAMSGVYNSGLLCLAITSDAIPLISSGTLSLLIPGVDSLALQKEKQSVAIVVRPGTPPRLTFGNGTSLETDPLVRLQLDQASFDFYLWSTDRYIRFMTATYDLDVPVNLEVTPEGLVPVLEDIGVNNGKVTNSALLNADPNAIAQGLAELISGQVGQALGGGIDPIDINGSLASLGLTLTIPPTVDGQGSAGLRKLTKGSDNYLGIFASFGLATPAALTVSDTHAVVKSKEVEAEGLRLPTISRDNAPKVRLVMGSDLDDGSRAMEYQVRVDNGVWRPFTRERIIDVQDSWLRLQGRHVISVRSRIAGEPLTLDPTPAEVEVLVDQEAPVIQVGEVDEAGRAKLVIQDHVSGAERAEVRFRLDGGEWSSWQRASEVGAIEVGEADDVEVEARDEEGNLGTSQQALIRGRVGSGGDAGCGCEVAGGTTRTGGAAGWLAGLVLAAFGARLRRRRGAGKGGVGKGEAEGAERSVVGQGPVVTAAREVPRGRRTLGRQATHGVLGALMVVATAGAQAGCNCGDVETPNEAQCGEGCTTLEPGLIGAYTSVAVDGSTVWVAGYAEGNRYLDMSWGDLAIGRLDGDAVSWSVVDGVPAEPAVDPTRYNTKGFRGGQTEKGEDVGLWTSIAIGPDGQPAVAYYDRTNRRLKFAQLTAGSWAVSVVQEVVRGDIGRYAKLVFLNGTPVIGYLAIEPAADGSVVSSVRLARGASAVPRDGQWTFEDVASDPATPCRAFMCEIGSACVAATGRCVKPTDECGECGSDEACADDGTGQVSCQAVFGDDKLDTYPDAIGDYVAIAPDTLGGLGVAYYDRIHGNAVVASKESGSWESVIADGQAADGTDTGDVGMGLSLFIDESQAWHLTYADGLSEGVRYVQVRDGMVGQVEVFDDGLQIEGAAFEDGQHIVGDDSNLFVTSGGEVHVSYQDATSGTLRYAVGTPSGGAHTWLVRELPQQSFAGAFSKIVQVDGQVRVANWWRVGGMEPKGDVAFISP